MDRCSWGRLSISVIRSDSFLQKAAEQHAAKHLPKALLRMLALLKKLVHFKIARLSNLYI